MRSPRRRLGQGMVYGAFLLLGACGEDSHSAPGRAETRVEHLTTDEPGNLAPLDLVYVCGNKFLATNSHRRSVHPTWRVLGTPETGSIPLSPGPTEDPEHSEAELESGATGTSVDLCLNGKLIQTPPNDGRHTTAHRFKGTATGWVKICRTGSATVCSPERTIALSN